MSNLASLSTQDTFYKERRGHDFAYWTYDDGRRVSISGPWAEKQAENGSAKIVFVD